MIFNTETFAELKGENWEYSCDKEKNCIIGIKSFMTDKETNEKRTLATIYINILNSTQKKLNLLDENDQTYKMDEVTLSEPAIFILFPLNTDLRVKPIMRVGGKNISGLSFIYCNQNSGCNAMLTISDEVVKLFEKEKEMGVAFRPYGANQNVEFIVPLKNFTKSYKKLIKS